MDNKEEKPKKNFVTRMIEYKTRFTKGYSSFSSRCFNYLEKYHLWILGIILLILSLTIRYVTIMAPTNDIVGYIFSWINQIKGLGFKNFYQVNADYSTFYLFFIAIISLLPQGEQITVGGYTFFANYMYYVKTFYYLFELASALGIFFIIKHLTKNSTKSLIGSSVYMFLPTIFINSTVWGNCDCIYFCFFIWCIYSLLKRKDGWAWTCFGLAFSFKMQAVFLLPFLVYLVASRRLKFYKCFWAFMAFFITLLPAYLCGAEFTEPLHFIYAEVNGYKKLTLGCANFWQLTAFSSDASDVLIGAAPYIGLSLIGLFTAIIYMLHLDLKDDATLFKAGTFLICIVPFFLPFMHERYFYVLDALVVIYCLVTHSRYYLIPLMQVSSGIALYHYLSGKYFIAPWGEDSVSIAAFINLTVLGLIFYDLIKSAPKKTLILGSDSKTTPQKRN